MSEVDGMTPGCWVRGRAARGRRPEAGRPPRQRASRAMLRHCAQQAGVLWVVMGLALVAQGAGGGSVPVGGEETAGRAAVTLDPRAIESLRAAIGDLGQTFGKRYPRGADFLARLDEIERGGDGATRVAAFEALHQEALLANPLLEGMRLLVVKRKVSAMAAPKGHKGWWSRNPGLEIGMPSNHECNSSLNKDGFDDEIAVLSKVAPDGEWRTLHRPANRGYAGEVDLNWDGERMLFTQSDPENWKIWEIRADGTGLRQVSRMPADVDCMDPCYLPDGRILFGSTA